MSATNSNEYNRFLFNIPYCYLRKIKNDQDKETYELFYNISIPNDHVVSEPKLTISDKIVHVTFDISIQTGIEGTEKFGIIELPVLNQAGEKIIKVEASGVIFPSRQEKEDVSFQPQRSGTTTINYQDADDE